MLQAGPSTWAKGDFTGCYPCSAGYFGTAPNHTSPVCEAACWPGHFCPEGSTEPRPCPTGTYLPAPGAATNASCIPCTPGSFSAISGNGNQSCTPCALGTFSSVPRATNCSLCEPGGFCASVGAASASMTFEQCPGAFTWYTRDHHHISMVLTPHCPCLAAGYYNPDSGSSSNASCRACEAGKANPVPGSRDASVCTDCLPGSFTNSEGKATCTPCAPGTYQNASGATVCVECPEGAYCTRWPWVPGEAHTKPHLRHVLRLSPRYLVPCHRLHLDARLTKPQ